MVAAAPGRGVAAAVVVTGAFPFVGALPGNAAAVATITTQASTNSTTAQPGASVSDAATLAGAAGAPVPTGTVTYTLVGPNPNAGCTSPILGSSTQSVGSASAPFTVTTPGTYNFVVTYSGDAN